VEADLAVLTGIFKQADPPQITVQIRKLVAIYFGFGDSLGLGFGDSFLKANEINYCAGVWGSDEKRGFFKLQGIEEMRGDNPSASRVRSLDGIGSVFLHG
jgi:hypothetical protein